MSDEPNISDLFARLIVAARRGDLMQMNDMPEPPDGGWRSKAELEAAIHKRMFTKLERSESTPKGFSLNPHPLFWMGSELFPPNAGAMSREDRGRLVRDAMALMEAGINPLPYPVTTFGVLHRVERKLIDAVVSGGEVLFIRCKTVKRSDPVERPDLVLPAEYDEAISIDLFIGHLKRVWRPQNIDPHGWRYCGARVHLSIGVKPMLWNTMTCAHDGVTESGKKHSQHEIQDATMTVMASLALLNQQRTIIQRNLEPPSYKLRQQISNRLNPLKPMVRVDLSAYQYRYPFDYATHPAGGAMKAPHDRSGHVRHLRDGRTTQVSSSKIHGGAPNPRTYVVGNHAENRWPDRTPVQPTVNPPPPVAPGDDQHTTH